MKKLKLTIPIKAGSDIGVRMYVATGGSEEGWRRLSGASQAAYRKMGETYEAGRPK